jgi:hypothetical protein
MKICDRCFEEYSDEEFVKMDQFPDCLICIPCNYQYSDLYKDFLIKFINNQPERSKREDSVTYQSNLDKTDGYKDSRYLGIIERNSREMRCSEHYGDIVRDK